jgi:hypothetical protein
MTTKRSLSPAARKLIEWMQRINFGRIHHLRFRDGEPVFDPAPRAVREHRFGGERGPRKELALQDFALRKEVIELLEFMHTRRNGVITVLIIKHGLPFDMVLPDEPGIAC